jgi:glycosyltransferase involved in cell wall biosynthesis
MERSTLVAIPVYNEAKHVRGVLDAVRPFAANIVTIDDGSTDGTSAILAKEPGICRVVHPHNRGYGAAISSAFDFALMHGFKTLVTMDCDGQHEPHRIPVLLEALHNVDIVSGSRYLRDFRQDTPAPTDRRYINTTITNELNAAYGLDLTDAFCGFKAYRVEALRPLTITETGWGMPLELWVQAAKLGLTIREVGVPRLYLDPNRAFGGVLNDPTERLAYYRQIIARADASFSPRPVLATCQYTSCPEWD